MHCYTVGLMSALSQMLSKVANHPRQFELLSNDRLAVAAKRRREIKEYSDILTPLKDQLKMGSMRRGDRVNEEYC